MLDHATHVRIQQKFKTRRRTMMSTVNLFYWRNGGVEWKANLKNYRRVVMVIILLIPVVTCTVPTVQYVTFDGNNSTTKLSCNVSVIQHTIWQFHRAGQGNWRTISIGEDSLDKDRFALKIIERGRDGNVIVLDMLEVNVESEGLYICQEDGQIKNRVNVTIEIPPVVALLAGKETIGDVFDVEFGKEINVSCVSKMAKPPVSLSWRVNGQEEIANISTETSRGNERIVISTLTYIPNMDDTNLTCVASGQIVVPSVRVKTKLNIQYKPRCFVNSTCVSENERRFQCQCESNPVVHNYTIMVNNSVFDDDVTLSTLYPVRLLCQAVNTIGVSDTAEYHHLITGTNDNPDSSCQYANTAVTHSVDTIIYTIIGMIILCLCVLSVPAVLVILKRTRENVNMTPEPIRNAQTSRLPLQTSPDRGNDDERLQRMRDIPVESYRAEQEENHQTSTLYYNIPDEDEENSTYLTIQEDEADRGEIIHDYFLVHRPSSET